MATILIADDDPIVRATVVEFLGAAGHSVSEACDGQQALDHIARSCVDLLILDMLMPNKDGLETILELRRSGSRLPILAISSGGRMDIQSLLRPAMAFGATQVLAKPLRRPELMDVVESLLGETPSTALA